MSIISHHRTLEPLLLPFRAVAFDVYGVLWNGKSLYPSVPDYLKRLRNQGKQVALMTNTTQLAAEVQSEYMDRGLLQGSHYDFIVTAGDLSRARLLSRKFNAISTKVSNSKYYVIGRANPVMFQETGMAQVNDLDEADFVYIGVPEIGGVRQGNVDGFRPELERFLAQEMVLFCPNPDLYAPSGDKMQACQGLIAQTYELMGGRVEWGGGKPFREIYDICADRFKISRHYRHQIAMVGDTLRTDIAGGRQAGYSTILVTGTGLTADAVRTGQNLEDLYRESHTRPHFTVDCVAA